MDSQREHRRREIRAVVERQAFLREWLHLLERQRRKFVTQNVYHLRCRKDCRPGIQHRSSIFDAIEPAEFLLILRTTFEQRHKEMRQRTEITAGADRTAKRDQ